MLNVSANLWPFSTATEITIRLYPKLKSSFKELILVCFVFPWDFWCFSAIFNNDSVRRWMVKLTFGIENQASFGSILYPYPLICLACQLFFLFFWTLSRATIVLKQFLQRVWILFLAEPSSQTAWSSQQNIPSRKLLESFHW